MSTAKNKFLFTAWWIKQIIVSSIIVAILGFIVFNFYILSSVISFEKFFFVFLIISGLTDGLFVLIHLPRRSLKHSGFQFDPSKLTIVIACYNGEDVIQKTIDQAMQHVPAKQIIVVSDASTDKTSEIAKQAGVRVLVNQRNVNKAFSITRAVQHVMTPYTLILDDDTLIGDTFIPTSLLDEGYTAVAFDVMPTSESSIINRLQRYEYRKSMQLGKNLRAKVGAIGNVSGAIGLFHTEDLKRQTRLHSGQFGGEDEQRTILTHLYSDGKGIVFSNSLVLTKAPDTWAKLLKQRAFSWSLSLPELLFLYTRILFSPNYHYLLKSEKAYQLYIFLTDPLRILLIWVLLTRPSNILAAYLFYVALSAIVWVRTKCKDPWWVVLLYPFYSLIISLCRFAGNFYWLKLKARDIFKDKFYRVANQRKLLLEYALALVVIGFFWFKAITHFNSDMSILSKIRSSRLEDNSQQFNYENVSPTIVPGDNNGDNIILLINSNDSLNTIAHRAIDIVLAQDSNLSAAASSRQQIDSQLASTLKTSGFSVSNSYISIPRQLVRSALVIPTTPVQENKLP
ncbi:MAG: pgaC 2 [Candidatus Saccharibacteria bacterium]|nr:pgaC 2 [Candidatus Saccharibacteria bacterium]